MHDSHEWMKIQRDTERIVATMHSWLRDDQRDDIAQNTSMRLLRLVQDGKKRLSDLSKAYIRRVAFSTMANMWKQQKRRGEDALDGDLAATLAAAGGNPETESSRRQLGHLIAEHLGRLPLDRRRAVHLCVLLGHSVPEAAALLGFSRKKTENLVHRGRQQLRASLAEELETSAPERLQRSGVTALLGWLGP